MLVTDFSPQFNFWDITPRLKFTFDPHIKAYEKDKRSEELSQIMWAIAFCCDYDTPYFNYPYEDKLLMSLDQARLPKDTILPQILIDQYNKDQFDSEKRFLAIWNKKVDELANLIERTPVTLDNMEDIAKQLLNVDKLLKQKDEIEKRVKKKKEDNIRGGGHKSLLESGL
jgi:hypothetical protein